VNRDQRRYSQHLLVGQGVLKMKGKGCSSFYVITPVLGNRVVRREHRKKKGGKLAMQESGKGQHTPAWEEGIGGGGRRSLKFGACTFLQNQGGGSEGWKMKENGNGELFDT